MNNIAYQYLRKQASMQSDITTIKRLAEDERKSKRLNLANSLDSGLGKVISESAGVYTSKIAPITASAALVYNASKRDGDKGNPIAAMAGAAGGYLTTKLVDKLMATIGKYQKVRSLQDQKEYEDSSVASLLNYLVPGAAEYNKARSMRLAYSNDVHDKRNS